jgi:hypothetical protein
MAKKNTPGIGKPYDGLYAEMERALKAVQSSLPTAEDYLRGIAVIRESIDQLRLLATELLRTVTAEIDFFRHVWPVFFGKLYLYIWLHRLCMHRMLVPADGWPAFIKGEEERAESFFRQNVDFWCYYKSGASVIDGQFTRSYSRDCIFEPLALAIDQEHATLASLEAAKGLAFEEYLVCLKGDLRMPAGASVGAENGPPAFEFDGTDAEGQEWLMELFASKVIRRRGGDHLNLSEMNRWFKANFGREFGKFFDKLNVLRNRKIDPLRFLNKRLRATEQWMREKGGVGKH